jgi:predicted LPLAT superfamily acyltransferase
MAQEQWRGKTGGKEWMLRWLILFLRGVDVRVLYVVMSCVIPFYMLFSHKSYLAIYHFFRRQFHYSPLKAFCRVYANHFVFGQVILDRFAIYAGQHFDIAIEGNEYFTHLATQQGGFILLSSHVGNFELAGYSLGMKDKRFYSLVFPGEKETVKENRSQILRQHNVVLVPVGGDMSHLFIIYEALQSGNIVTMPGDRIFGSQKSVTCKYFEGYARFPLGPFALAVQRGVPILTIFVMKESARRYRILVSPLQLSTEDRQAGKKEQMTALADQFAMQLEQIVRSYPTQWFNYYEFNTEQGSDEA